MASLNISRFNKKQKDQMVADANNPVLLSYPFDSGRIPRGGPFLVTLRALIPGFLVTFRVVIPGLLSGSDQDQTDGSAEHTGFIAFVISSCGKSWHI